jgi:hypothetical protein
VIPAPTFVQRLASSSMPGSSHHPHCELILMQCHRHPDGGGALRRSLPASHSHRSEETQGRLRKSDKAGNWYVPRGAEEGFARAITDSMGRDHATHCKIPWACSQIAVRVSNLVVSDCRLHVHSSPHSQLFLDEGRWL